MQRNRFNCCIEGMSSLWKFVGVCFIGYGGNDTFRHWKDVRNVEEKSNPWLKLSSIPVKLSQCKVPLTKQKLTEKVEEDLAKANASENLFWTPEHVSIVQASNLDEFDVFGGLVCLWKDYSAHRESRVPSRNPSNTIHSYLQYLGLTRIFKVTESIKKYFVIPKEMSHWLHYMHIANLRISTAGINSDVAFKKCRNMKEEIRFCEFAIQIDLCRRFRLQCIVKSKAYLEFSIFTERIFCFLISNISKSNSKIAFETETEQGRLLSNWINWQSSKSQAEAQMLSWPCLPRATRW